MKIEISGENFGTVTYGAGKPVYIAGPCAVESRSQMYKIAEGVKRAGAHILRGGVVKPRSSVHSWQGYGGDSMDQAEEGYSILHDAGVKFEMPTVSEVRGEGYVDLAAQYVDVLQIGARNMYNQDLLMLAAQQDMPILYKRNFGASIEEYLSFCEYIAAEGNLKIILCERGMLPFGVTKGVNPTRYVMDISAIPVIQKMTFLPIIADPSHGTGRRDLIANMTYAAMAAGSAGFMIETHDDPEHALVDGPQQITPDELTKIIITSNAIHKVINAKW